MLIEIKDRSGELLYSHVCEVNSVKKTVEKAVIRGVPLPGAALIERDMRGADMREAVLAGSEFTISDFSGADFSGADLSEIYAYKADFSGTDFSGTDLRGAYINRVNLSGANFSGADLSGACLVNVNLDGIVCDSATCFTDTSIGEKIAYPEKLIWDVCIIKNYLTLDKKPYTLSSFDKYLSIGCQDHSIKDWESFDDERISKMASGALKFWKKHRDNILSWARDNIHDRTL